VTDHSINKSIIFCYKRIDHSIHNEQDCATKMIDHSINKSTRFCPKYLWSVALLNPVAKTDQA